MSSVAALTVASAFNNTRRGLCITGRVVFQGEKGHEPQSPPKTREPCRTPW